MNDDTNVILDFVKIRVDQKYSRATMTIGKELLRLVGIQGKEKYKFEYYKDTGEILLTPLKPSGLGE